MSMFSRWPLPAVLPALAVALLVSGCGKYDALERNMQYISTDLLRKESVVAYERLGTAHAAWRATPSDESLATYKEFYAQYAVIYNELMDRSGQRMAARLAAFSETLPPPPPGMPAKSGGPDASAPAPAGSAAPARSAPPAPGTSLAPTAPATPSAAATAPMTTAEAGDYVVRPGDTPHTIAKALGVNEARLMEANGITDPGKLSIGKRLRVPAP